jgi:hypothetical protein
MRSLSCYFSKSILTDVSYFLRMFRGLHHGMARLEDVFTGGEHQIWRVAANMLKISNSRHGTVLQLEGRAGG